MGGVISDSVILEVEIYRVSFVDAKIMNAGAKRKSYVNQHNFE